MAAVDWYVLKKEDAVAYGTPDDGRRFLVRAGSTAMKHGSPNEKRNRDERDSLVRSGVLVPDPYNPNCYRFAVDHIFSSPSAAGGVIIDGNLSGPSKWKRQSDGKSLKDVLNGL